jgi:fatty acid desaturase
MGFSATYWWHKHWVHHKNTNVVGVDADIDLMPIFVMTTDEFDRSRGLARAFYSIQWLFFPFALAINSLNMQRYSVQHLLGTFLRRRKMDRRPLIDAILMLLHFVLWLIVPIFFFSWLNVLGFYLCQRAIFGYLMFMVFAPSHYPHEAAFVRPDADAGNYVLSQTATTVNYRTGWIGRMMCSGLQYQIEHHLFPDVSHTCYPRLSTHLRAYCRNHGYPYREISWDRSLWKSLLVLYKPKEVEDQLNLAGSPGLSRHEG